MAGNKAGGAKAAATNKLRYGEDFYKRIGGIGGANGNTGGFAANVPCNCNMFIGEHLIRNCAGHKGGTKSRRGRSTYANTEQR